MILICIWAVTATILLFLLIVKNKIIYRKINEILENCTDNQLAVVLNILKESVPFIKE